MNDALTGEVKYLLQICGHATQQSSNNFASFARRAKCNPLPTVLLRASEVREPRVALSSLFRCNVGVTINELRCEA
jgi:hypothetical protein